jgi:dihydropteroate synthase
VKDTILRENSSINCGGNLLSLKQPIVMGIINITPDSFYDGGKTNSIAQILSQAKTHLDAGARILDVGGYSSRPGADEVNEAEELNRITPAIQAIAKEFPTAIISIDTFRSNVAKTAIDNGAQIVNDISAGDLDKNMMEVVGQFGTPYIMMHMQNSPKTMQINPTYENILLDITSYFSSKILEAKSHGIKDIILDPGFGFGKTIEDNYKLLKNLSHFNLLEHPVLAGISRKSMLYKPLSTTPQNALNATTAAHMIALQQGAKILRVHDVQEAMEAIMIYNL